MTQRDAVAVAELLCRTHGEQAEEFIKNQIRRYQAEAKAEVAVAAWQLVASEVEKMRAARLAA